MIDDSLTIVQNSSALGGDATTPLVLLHDGGGTIYGYHALGPLHRNVYGISDPRFENGRTWEGGIPEMAQVYAQMIRAKVPHGNILLGGWSFGGLLALEISLLFANDADFNIVGLILIDTPYPKTKEGGALVGVNHLPDIPGVRPRLRAKIHSSLQNAKKMVMAWQLPRWEKEQSRVSLEQSRPSIDFTRASLDFAQASLELDDNALCRTLSRPSLLRKPPPAVLLRAASSVDAVGSRHERSGHVALVDIFRKDPTLGWNEYDNAFIRVVWDIPGDHFSIFGAPFVAQVTEKIVSACQYLSS